MKKFWIMGILFYATLLHAYVLPPSYFFQQWAAQNKTPQTFQIKQERDFLENGTITKTVSETVVVRRSGMYKWASEISGQEEIKILGRTKATIGNLQGQRSVPLQEVITPIEAMFIYQQSGTIESVMKQIGVDVTQSGLELIQKRKEVRVGDKKGNRIYIAPDTNTLDAMVFRGKLYLLKYNQEKFFFYPAQVEIFENDILKERIKINSVLANAKILESEFESN